MTTSPASDRALLKEAWREAHARLTATSRWRVRKWARAHRTALIALANARAEGGLVYNAAMPTPTWALVTRWLCGLFWVAVVVALACAAIRDITTLDPMPDGVTQRGTTFIVPISAHNVHADPDHLCARLSGDDDPFESNWTAAQVTTQGDHIKVRCGYR